MDIAEALVTLNLRLGDTNNFTFTSDEKNQALKEAFNDQDAVSVRWDSSLTFSTTSYQYAKPASIGVLQGIYIKPSNSTETDPVEVTSNVWEVVGDNIHFKNGANTVIPSGYTLFLRGKYKYTTTDDIAEINVQEFILNLAQLHCLNMLGVKKALSFLKNDTSVSEIIAIKRELERKVAQYRQRLPRTFEAA